MGNIYKYELEIKDNQSLYLPFGARILSVCEQYNRIVLYAIIDKDEDKKQKYDIKIFGTGHEIPLGLCKDYKFLGTVKLYDGKYMFHIFIIKLYKDFKLGI